MSKSPLPEERRTAAPASLLYRPASYFERLPIASMFRASQPLEVELGSGDGNFLVDYACRHPDHNFLGIERLLGRIRKIDRKGLRAGLVNLSLLRIEAGYFLEWLLPDQCVWRLHIYFPDPWPKRRHVHNRLVGERFPGLAQRVLQPGGRVYLRTDNPDYHAQMREVFAVAPAFLEISTPIELAALTTDFEKDFNAKDIETLRLAFELASSTAGSV